jgi:hypothetical protein
LAAVGFLFLTVVSVVVQFAVLGVITAILAVGIVAFDSWVNRPKGLSNRRANTDTGAGRNTGWRGNSVVENRPRPPAQNFRAAPRPTSAAQRRQPPPTQRQPNGQPPRQPNGQPQRQQPGQQRQQPLRQPPPPLGQPPQGQPPQGQPPQGQPPQGQPPRPPFRPTPPDPGRTRR